MSKDNRTNTRYDTPATATVHVTRTYKKPIHRAVAVEDMLKLNYYTGIPCSRQKKMPLLSFMITVKYDRILKIISRSHSQPKLS